MHGKRSCLNRKFHESTFEASERLPSRHKHHLGQEIASLLEHEQHREHREEISLLLQELVSLNHEVVPILFDPG
jgi:hypothetical protein